MPSRWFTPFDTFGWLEGVHMGACVLCVDGRVGGGQGADMGGRKERRELVGVMKKI